MSSIGPQLPPLVTKRKRTPDDDGVGSSPRSKTARASRDDRSSSSDESYRPSRPDKRRPSPRKERRPIGPAMPATRNQDEIDLSDSGSSDAGPAPPPPTKRTFGPSMPPAPSVGRPQDLDSGSGSDSDDDYGPALPSTTSNPRPQTGPSAPAAPELTKRDDWMLAPPTQTNYRERDTTKIKARTFRSNPSAPQPGIASIWTETASEKLARLQNSVLGREDATNPAASTDAKKSKADREDAARRQREIDEYNAKTRGTKSLYEERKEMRRKDKGASPKPGDEDDDPSQRAFDWEKDMAVSGKLGGKEKREILTKASNLGGRFQKGSYL